MENTAVLVYRWGRRGRAVAAAAKGRRRRELKI